MIDSWEGIEHLREELEQSVQNYIDTFSLLQLELERRGALISKRKPMFFNTSSYPGCEVFFLSMFSSSKRLKEKERYLEDVHQINPDLILKTKTEITDR